MPGYLDTFLSTWPEADQDAFRDFMRWAIKNRPQLSWDDLTAKFTEILPHRTEDDLRRVFVALSKDAPMTALLELMPPKPGFELNRKNPTVPSPRMDAILDSWPEPDRQRGHEFMDCFLTRPGPADDWNSLVKDFTASTGRPENDLRQLLEALEQDYPVMQLSKLMPSKNS